MAKQYRLSGIGTLVELGKNGARIKNSSGVIEARNNADNAYAIMRVADPVGADDVVNKRTLDASTVSGVTRSLRATLEYNTSSPLTIGSVTANGIVSRVIVKVTTVFDGASPTLEIGIASDTDKYMTNNEIDLSEVGTYVVNLYELESTPISAIATYTADSSTTGSASILLDFASA